MRLKAFGAVPSPKPQAATMTSYGRRHPEISSDGYDVRRSTLFQDLGCRRCLETSGDGVRLTSVSMVAYWFIRWSISGTIESGHSISDQKKLDGRNPIMRVSSLCKLGVEVMELCASRSVVAPGTPKRNFRGVAGSRHLVITRPGTLPVEQGNPIIPSRKHVVEELPVVPVVGYEG
ncbi:hypothetical protein B296_00046294 [Ensete ventricosum]|uniref:Uncharacterized protein n=1 Tax=Ensete ventricosum TaxID=4639 RepID=A0A426XRA8_ENSVE|nr:hypothetical protein B296_00046294 [Ensete ventricosum]